jgi:hypothetical protein
MFWDNYRIESFAIYAKALLANIYLSRLTGFRELPTITAVELLIFLVHTRNGLGKNRGPQH